MSAPVRDIPTHPLEIAIEPRSKFEWEKLVAVLEMLAADDPLFRFALDAESRQILLKGMSELHLDTQVDILQRIHKIDVNIGAPQVAYRETLKRSIEIDETYKKLAGGVGQFARIKMIFDPQPIGSGSSFESRVSRDAVPEEYIPGIEKGIDSVMNSGILAGFPVVNVKLTLIDGAFHNADSSVLAFESCASAAFRRALKEGGSILLEPIMKVEVTSPEDYLGSIRGDLLSRLGRI